MSFGFFEVPEHRQHAFVRACAGKAMQHEFRIPGFIAVHSSTGWLCPGASRKANVPLQQSGPKAPSVSFLIASSWTCLRTAGEWPFCRSPRRASRPSPACMGVCSLASVLGLLATSVTLAAAWFRHCWGRLRHINASVRTASIMISQYLTADDFPQ